MAVKVAYRVFHGICPVRLEERKMLTRRFGGVVITFSIAPY